MEDSEGAEGSQSPMEGSERARLTEGTPSQQRPSAMAIAGSLTALVFVGYVVYLSLENGVTLFSFHPIFMTVGWLLVISSGLNAFSSAGITIQWMPIQNRTTRHWVLQSCGLTLVTAGFAVIFANKIILGKSHFATWHGTLGLMTFVMTLATSSGGLIALYSMKFKQYLAPVYIKLAHSAVGIMTYTLAILTMSLPFLSGWWKGDEFVKIILVLMLLFVLVWTTLRPTVKLYARVRERINYIRTPN